MILVAVKISEMEDEISELEVGALEVQVDLSMV